MAVVSPRNANEAQIGAIFRWRFDLNVINDWVHAGEFLTNDVFVNPTTKERSVSHVQIIPLQMLNDIISVTNKTKINNRTKQRLLNPFTKEQILQYAHANKALVSPDDNMFFVGELS